MLSLLTSLLTSTRARTLGLPLVALILTPLFSPLATADLIAIGDTNPAANTIPDNAGNFSPFLIVGETGIGGLFMDIAPPLSGVLMPLQNDFGTLGEGINAVGAAVFDDFGVRWEVADTLIVGNFGQGFLDVFDSAAIVVGDPDLILPIGNTLVGDGVTGQGVITLNGIASRLETFDLIVGDEGVGSIEINDRGSMNSRSDAVIGNAIGSDGTVSLTGLGSRWTACGPILTPCTVAIAVGNNGFGKLAIDDQALVQAAGPVAVGPFGTVDLSGGTLRMLNSQIITNAGLIRGDGFVDGAVNITGTGELRNAAGVANERERLIVSGAVNNLGTIESLGGEMEFLAPVVNDLEIIARDAIMRFPAGLTNNGTLSIGGNTTIHGPITSGGAIFVLSGSESLLVGDITFSASSLVSLAVGDSPGTLDVLGTADLDGAFLALNYSAGVAAQVGDSYDVFSASGGFMGTNFANSVAVADGLIWDILYGSTTVTVTALGATLPVVGPDFNGDGIVNGLDYFIWEMNFPTPSGAAPGDGDADGDGDVDGFDFIKWQMQNGGAPVPLVGAVVATVPEPSALLLAIVAGLGLCTCRRIR